MREVPRLFKYPADVGTFTPNEKGLSILAKELVPDWNLIMDALADELHQKLLGSYTIGTASGTPGILVLIHQSRFAIQPVVPKTTPSFEVEGLPHSQPPETFFGPILVHSLVQSRTKADTEYE